MPDRSKGDAFGAARNAYREQIEFGSPPGTALDLATIVYQQRNPRVPTREARELIAEALGVAPVQGDARLTNF